MNNPFKKRPSVDKAQVEQSPQAAPARLVCWRRNSHWNFVFCPGNFLYADFELQADGQWAYTQPGHQSFEAIYHENVEVLMAQAELDWAAHSQLLRQADEQIDLYNRRWFLPPP